MPEITLKKWKEVRLADLSVRYIPVVTPIDLWNHDMSLKNSPHVELLRTIKKHGFDWGILKKTRYWKERKYRYDCGVKRWTSKHRKEHIKKRWAIYKSLKKKGFKKKDSPVTVLKQPFWTTRFGLEEDWMGGLECYNGMGRCSSLYVLGKRSVKVMICKDKYPGSNKKGKFEHKLKDIQGVWPEN